jgi:hypothetical protein
MERTSKRRYWPWLVAMTAFFLVVGGAIALADMVMNDAQATGNDMFTLGGSTTITYWIQATGGDSENGCNASDGTPATVAISAPASVTATPSSLTFTACHSGGDFNTQDVVFTASAAGDYSISATVSDSGPGSYTTNHAAFTLHVLAAGLEDATCDISGYTGVYDGDSHGATGECTDGDTVLSGLDLGASYTDVPGGTAHWTFSHEGYNSQSGDVAIVISKADASCSISGYTGVYDTLYHGASGSCSGIGGESAGTLNLGGTFKDVPGGTAHWVFAGNGNYNDQSGDVDIVISKADATCTISGWSGLFDYASHGASGSCSGIGGESAGTLNLGVTYTYPPGGPAHWVFTGNGNYNDQFGDVDIVIVAWTLHGFYQPVDMPHVLNTVKGGSTVPLKFEVFAGSTELTDTSAVYSLMYAPMACDATTVQDAIETVATGGTVLRYDFTAGQFVYNWQTPRTPGKCYVVTMTTQDHSTLVALFKTK